MDVKKLQKMVAAGGSELQKAIGEMNDGLATLESKVRELETKPIIVPETSYCVLEKADDDAMAHDSGQRVRANGHAVDVDSFARDVRKFAGA